MLLNECGKCLTGDIRRQHKFLMSQQRQSGQRIWRGELIDIREWNGKIRQGRGRERGREGVTKYRVTKMTFDCLAVSSCFAINRGERVLL